MNRCDQLALAGVIIVSLEGVAFTHSFAFHLYFSQMPIAQLLIAVVGWVMVTYGPIIVATLLWGLAKRSSAPWLLHFLLLPSFWALLVAGNSLMLSTLNVPDFDDTLGAPIMPALLVMTVTIALYASALVLGRLSGLRGQTNGS